MHEMTTASQWQVVWLKTVAKAWQDKAFESALKKDPRQALKSAFDFEFPPGVTLSLQTGEEGSAFETAQDGSCIQLRLPPQPADAEQAVALANLADETAKSCCGHPCC
jgi:ribosomally synthesized peptide (two-chain TOMM family)